MKRATNIVTKNKAWMEQLLLRAASDSDLEDPDAAPKKVLPKDDEEIPQGLADPKEVLPKDDEEIHKGEFTA